MVCTHNDHATYMLRPRNGENPLLLWCRQCGAILVCGAGSHAWALPQSQEKTLLAAAWDDGATYALEVTGWACADSPAVFAANPYGGDT